MAIAFILHQEEKAISQRDNNSEKQNQNKNFHSNSYA